MKKFNQFEGKTIDSITQNNDGKNSYFILKFTDGSKLNIVGYISSDDDSRINLTAKTYEEAESKLYIEESLDDYVNKSSKLEEGFVSINIVMNTDDHDVSRPSINIDDRTPSFNSVIYDKVGPGNEEELDYEEGEIPDEEEELDYEEGEIPDEEEELDYDEDEEELDYDEDEEELDYDEDEEDKLYEIDDDEKKISSLDMEEILSTELSVDEIDRSKFKFKDNKFGKEHIGVVLAKLASGNYLFMTDSGVKKAHIDTINEI